VDEFRNWLLTSGEVEIIKILINGIANKTPTFRQPRVDPADKENSPIPGTHNLIPACLLEH